MRMCVLARQPRNVGGDSGQTAADERPRTKSDNDSGCYVSRVLSMLNTPFNLGAARAERQEGQGELG
ncbi:hypothetical protein GCM10010350_43150 [Streptomyces galilaeus]|nr:hypothetical protein GCM10010350_43150 [Streptomyces galilaeus]